MVRQLIKYYTITVFLFTLGCVYNTDGQTTGFKASFQNSAELCRYVDVQKLEKSTILSVPYVKQKPNYCGPASVAMVMQYMGSDVTQEEIGLGIVDSTGTSPSDLSDRTDTLGYNLSVISCGFNNLLSILDGGKPVIVRILNSSKDNGHYIVVTGYDIDKMLIYINDPEKIDRDSISFSEFRTLWDINTLSQEQNSYNLMLVMSSK